MADNLATGEVSSTDSNFSGSINSNQGIQQSPSLDDYVHKSKVTDLIHERTKSSMEKGYERGRNEALAQLQSQQTSQQSYTPSMGGMQQASEDKIRQMIAETAQQQLQQMQANGMWQGATHTFVQRIHAAKDKYPELGKNLSELDFESNPVNQSVIFLANAVDNTADVMKELYDKPEKLGMLTTLIKDHGQAVALRAMQNLSNSIRENQNALKQPQAKEPLSQLKPSTSGVDSGEMTQADWRKKYRG